MGTDVLWITGGVTISDISLSNVSTYDTKITINASVDEITVDNLRHSSGSYQIEIVRFDDGFETSLPDYASWTWGTASGETINGTSADETIIGMGGNDKITGGAGADDIHGGAGNDILTGDGGVDLLHGGVGHDGLYGGDGADILHGGGADTFLFRITDDGTYWTLSVEPTISSPWPPSSASPASPTKPPSGHLLAA